MADARLTIRPFDKALHDRGAFSSGVEKMDRWLRESIGDEIRQNRLRVWCAVDPDGAFVGYYALSMHSVAPGEAPNLARKRERHPVPAIYLNALAVNDAHQGVGTGAALLGDAILRCIRISNEIGAAAIILDVLADENHERRRAFHTNLGFAEIGGGDPNRLYLSIRDAQASAGSM